MSCAVREREEHTNSCGCGSESRQTDDTLLHYRRRSSAPSNRDSGGGFRQGRELSMLISIEKEGDGEFGGEGLSRWSMYAREVKGLWAQQISFSGCICAAESSQERKACTNFHPRGLEIE
ncbi:unnamed protein product [Lactuca saligna]|uniref:Uncharacterized protein n=1 Tax=Lactuca saligna TaxID=75948 RepID=A0AA36E2X6_LACSI|nr:unnamed protein product [Lactuca saligna]